MNMKTYSQMGSPIAESHVASIDYFESTTKTRWTKKRKIYIACILSIAAAIIVVAVVVPVMLTRRSRPSFSFAELYKPQGYNGTGINGLLEGTWHNRTHDRLVVFGSSYSDNAHPRASEYAGTLAGSGYWQGRWCDGPVWTERLKDYIGDNITHLNYAYAGATTNNSIHPSNSPDTSQQMAMYMEEGYTPGVKPLVAMFTTTNDITATFRDYLDPNNPIYHDRAGALNIITQSAQSLIRQLATLIPSDTSAVAPDYVILPILPVELTPLIIRTASEANVTTDMARDIGWRYNDVLLPGARSLAKQLGSRGSVYTYDVPSWFYAMADKPSNYWLKNTKLAFTQDGGSDIPEKYLWYDDLHLPSHFQTVLARMAANAVYNVESLP